MSGPRFTGREWRDFGTWAARFNGGSNSSYRPMREVNPRPAPGEESNLDRVGLVGRPELNAVLVLMPKRGLADRVLLEHTGEPVNVIPEFEKTKDALDRFVHVADTFARLYP